MRYTFSPYTFLENSKGGVKRYHGSLLPEFEKCPPVMAHSCLLSSPVFLFLSCFVSLFFVVVNSFVLVSPETCFGNPETFFFICLAPLHHNLKLPYSTVEAIRVRDVDLSQRGTGSVCGYHSYRRTGGPGVVVRRDTCRFAPQSELRRNTRCIILGTMISDICFF